MYIYQNGKLYAEIEGKKLVGVDIYSDKVLTVENTETQIGEEFEMLLPIEARARFVVDGKPYIFPREEKKGEIKDDTTGKVKKPVRKSTSK